MSQQNVSYWSTAVGLLTKTLPFLGVNIAVYTASFVISLIWFGIWGGLAYFAGSVLGIPLLGLIFIMVGLVVWGGVVKYAQRYILYMVKGAHIAAMTELLKGGQLPGGMSQFQYGREVVEQRFADVSMLYLLDRLVHGALRALQGKIIRIANWLPLPESIDGLVRAATEIMKRSLTYVDEAILSYAVYRGEDNVWNSARHGVLLYAQSYKPILITAAKLWLVGKVLGFVLLIFFFIPAGIAIGFMPNLALQLLVALVAVVAVFFVMQALFRPFALAYTLVTYHYEIAGKVPDPEWDERLRGVSDKFRELVGKAKEHGPGETQFEPAPAPQPNVA